MLNDFQSPNKGWDKKKKKKSYQYIVLVSEADKYKHNVY